MGSAPPSSIAAHLLIVLALSISSCTRDAPADLPDEGQGPASRQNVECDPDDGGISLPEGFCAVVVADDLGRLRHIAVRENGDVYVIHRELSDEGGITALRDTTGDGRADVHERFGRVAGTGIGVRNGFLYASTDTSLVRFRLTDELVPPGDPELIVGGFPEQESHEAKPFALDEHGNVFVNVGAPSNNCQAADRTPGSPGQDPCPLLEDFAGIWRFDADEPAQTKTGSTNRFATGIRNAVALAWNPVSDELYVVQHGRDQLSQLFPELYTEEDNAELPSEEFFLVDEGSDFGWPYCYYDHHRQQKVLAPEYGGDREEVGRCADAEDPIMAFRGHLAPNDLLFYTGDQFPATYRGGAFIAWHGSWNRAPLPQAGYHVSFVPFDGAQPADSAQTFADGFKGQDVLESPSDARYRPVGLAEGPDGSLYISDSQRGRIWRVVYRGS